MSVRAILVTGGNGSLGMAIARSFLKEAEQNFVWLGVRERRSEAEKLAADGRAECVELDVTDVDAWKRATKTIVGRHGRIDVLINNAGVHEDSLLAMMPADAWKRVLSTNLDGAFHGCQTVLPAMIAQRGGRIINVASLSALLAPPGQSNYAAAKAGLLAMSQSLAKEVARLGITVNVICPGYIDTEALKSLSKEDREAALARVPMRRFGRPEEIAAAVRFLACEEASYITGSVLKIDGGIL